MDALCRGGWMSAISSCVWMDRCVKYDALSRGGWMDALSR